jgi:hypothetical protein
VSTGELEALLVEMFRQLARRIFSHITAAVRESRQDGTEKSQSARAGHQERRGTRIHA